MTQNFTAQLNSAAFGVQQKRFTFTGLHPSLKKTGDNQLGPGSYNPKDPRCHIKENLLHKQPWRRALDSKEYSKNMGFRNAELLAERIFMRELLGPGLHDINFERLEKRDASSCKDMGFGCARRDLAVPCTSPGPARYGALPRRSKHPHVDGTFNKAVRWRDQSLPWQVPCNRYRIRDRGSMDATVARLVSRRGPYDLFTGPRDELNMFNKVAKGKPSGPDVIYTFSSAFDEFLSHPRNAKKGKFLIAPRFPSRPTVRNMLTDPSLCYRNSKDPGPAHYLIDGPTIGGGPVKEQRYAFGFSGLHVRESVNKELWSRPGPGRYHIKPVRCNALYLRRNPTSVFASRTIRLIRP